MAVKAKRLEFEIALDRTGRAAAEDGSSIAVPAILASQYAAVAVLIGVVTMGERLTRSQLAGVVAILGGVALVTAVQA